MTRIGMLRNLLRESDLSGIFVKGLPSIRYFTGFSGDDSLLFVDEERVIIFTDSRYTLQAENQAPNCLITECNEGLWKEAAKLRFSSKRIGFDGNHFTYQEFQCLMSQLDEIEWQSADLVGLRSIKDNDELQMIRKAVAISDIAFEAVLPKLHVGMSEIEAAAMLEYEMRHHGSEKAAFPTIVASGKRSALPHGLATSKTIEQCDFVTFDFGAVYQGYHSDITRTIVMGKASAWQREIYDIVYKAQCLGVANAKAGISGVALDSIVREYIKCKGYGDYFGHGLGHGVGLEIHELPLASRRGTATLETNMVVTIEPGIYIPGKGGVRIEDTIVIASEGCDILTGVNKQLLEIN